MKIVVVVTGDTIGLTVAGVAVINQITTFCAHFLLLEIVWKALKARLSIAVKAA